MRHALFALLIAASPAAAMDPNAEAGADVYFAFCTGCHGDDARGQGRVAPMLTVMPTNLRLLAQGNGGVFPVSDVVRQVDGRDPTIPHSGIMPAFGEYFGMESVAISSEDGQPIITSQPVADLVAFLEEIQE